VADPARRSTSRADRRRRDEGPPAGQERRRDVPKPVIVKWSIEPDGILIALTHSLVAGNCFAVRDRLAGYCDRFSAQRFTVDISGVPYADTAGMGVLMELKGRCLRDRKTLIICNPTARVREVLELLHLDRKLLAEQ